jgi:hypothetical protein
VDVLGLVFLGIQVMNDFQVLVHADGDGFASIVDLD